MDAQLRKGLLELCVLAVLRKEDLRIPDYKKMFLI